MGRTEELKKDLESEDYGTRRYAAEELGRLKAREAVPELIQLLQDPNWDVRKAAASALGDVGAEEAVPPLLPLLKDTDWFVRETVAIALGKIGDKSAAVALRECLQDEVYSVQKAANSALRKLKVDIEKVDSVSPEPVTAGQETAVEEKVSGDKRKGEHDARNQVVPVAEELGARFNIVKNGFDLRLGVSKGRSQDVEVRFEEGQIIYRTYCGPATPNNFLWALRANYTVEYGSLAVIDVKSQPTFVVVERQLEETADREEIRKAIWAVATFGDWVEKALTDEDRR